MKRNGVKTENGIWIQYALIILAFFVSFSILAYFSFNSITTMAKDDASAAAMSSVETDAEILNRILEDGIYHLDVVCRMTEYVWQQNLPLSEIESLFVAETERFRLEDDENFSGIYGWVKNRFIDAGGWNPDSSYKPQNRPWYRNAVRSLNQGVQLTAYENQKDGATTVTLSKVLSDKESVIALNVSRKNIRTAFKSRWDRSTRWMVLNKSGDVVSHYDRSLIGENFLSSKYWGTEIEELARRSLHTSNEKVRVVTAGKKQIAFVAPIRDQWFLVKMYDASVMAESARWTNTRNIMIAIVLFFVMSTLFSLGFLRHRRLSRMNRVRKFIRFKMGHEMHAAINGILGMNAVVIKSIHDEGTRTFSEGVQSALQDFGSLLKDVREISDNDGTIHVACQEYGLFEVLSECYKAILPKAKMKNLQVVFECDRDIPSGLWGDASHLRQILNNLLSDAVRRTESGSIWVSVNGYMEAKRPNSIEDYFMLQISIRDTGASVEKGRENSVDEWTDASAELCLAKLMLDACGGELVIKSRYGEGSTFMVSLNQLVLNKAPMGDFETRYNNQLTRESQTTEALFAPAARLLVVDDVETNLKVACGLLKETKIQIDTAVNGFQCLELVASKHYDMIFLDYSLPEMNGVEIFERMKTVGEKLNKNTPVIMVTAETVDFKDSFLKHGLADYMVKPYLEKDLLRMLAWYLPKELVLTQDDLQEFPLREKPKSVKPVNVEPEQENEEIEFHSVLTPEEKLSVFKGILDVQKGLEYFSRDVRCYYEVLKEFAHEDKRHGFDKTFQMKDWDNYLILVHSVFGMAQAIGAMDLAEKAQVVEKACKDYKFDELENLHQAFMTAYVETIEEISRGVSVYED